MQSKRPRPPRRNVALVLRLARLVPQLALLVVAIFAARPVAAYTRLSDKFLRMAPVGSDADFNIQKGQMLAPLLIPRVPGTPGQAQAQQHLVQYFQTQLPKWNMTWQNSTSKTPATGTRDVPFDNLIFRREPPWTKPGQANLLTLAAHYDSKLEPQGFIGATDSAVPVALLMHVAKSIDAYLTQMHDEMSALGEGGTPEMDMGVQILLLDGEEAFKSWTDTDSLYGSRSLAAQWDQTIFPARSNFKTPLNQISLFLLLDLLGSANPRVPSYFQNTHWAYKNMATIEARMRKLGLLESKSAPFLHDSGKLSNQFTQAYVQDDHVPFMARGAPILHIIPTPFPGGWHTMEDDGAHLDMPTVRDWSRIVTAFALEWLDMMEVEPKTAAS